VVTSPQKLAAEILAELAKALKNEDESALRELHSRVMQKRKRAAMPTSRKDAAKARAREAIPSDPETAKRFSNFPSREALENYLQDRYPEKVSIAMLARSLKVPVTKADNYDSLLDKIVDATVGYRLRAEAIRGRHSPS